MTGSPSSSDQKWQGGLLHDLDKEEEEEEDEEDEELPLSFANGQEKKQNQFPRTRVSERSDTLSSSSFASQRKQLLQPQEEHQNPRSREERYSSRASGRVLKVVQKFGIPGETEQERGDKEGIGTHTPSGGELLGSSGGDGWGVLGGGGEIRGQGEGGEEGWEMV